MGALLALLHRFTNQCLARLLRIKAAMEGGNIMATTDVAFVVRFWFQPARSNH